MFVHIAAFPAKPTQTSRAAAIQSETRRPRPRTICRMSQQGVPDFPLDIFRCLRKGLKAISSLINTIEFIVNQFSLNNDYIFDTLYSECRLFACMPLHRINQNEATQRVNRKNKSIRSCATTFEPRDFAKITRTRRPTFRP